MKRMCYVCETKPARKLVARKPYKYAVEDPVFCTLRCAADFGLLRAGIGTDGIPYWCETHGWQECREGDEPCDDCFVEAHRSEEAPGSDLE